MKLTALPLCMCLAFGAQAACKSSGMPEHSERNSSTKSQNTCQTQGEPLTCYGPAYNAPAAIYVNEMANITTFVDASFTYWYAGEEGLKLATSGVLSSGTDYFAQKTNTLFQSFDYTSGFKAGVGIVGHHEWMLHAEYTWFRGRNTTSSGAPLSATELTAGIATATASSGTAVWVVDDWFLQGTPSQALAGPTVSSTWRLSMDLIDAVASRPFYQARKFIAAPFGGLRAAFIRQSMTVNLTESTGLFSGAVPSGPIQSRNHSNSWAIGPRVGCEGKWLMPVGFRLEGDLALSLLYTSYTSVKHSEDVASSTFNPGPYTASYSDYGCLRPELDLGLGFGWGTYLHNQRYHIDFSADYDFMYFWSQNMMRNLLDDTLTGTSPSSSDLYLHGLTLTGRFNF